MSCNVLQSVAECCRVLQSVAVCVHDMLIVHHLVERERTHTHTHTPRVSLPLSRAHSIYSLIYTHTDSDIIGWEKVGERENEKEKSRE